jgi:hypothetical protein
LKALNTINREKYQPGEKKLILLELWSGGAIEYWGKLMNDEK